MLILQNIKFMRLAVVKEVHIRSDRLYYHLVHKFRSSGVNSPKDALDKLILSRFNLASLQFSDFPIKIFSEEFNLAIWVQFNEFQNTWHFGYLLCSTYAQGANEKKHWKV